MFMFAKIIMIVVYIQCCILVHECHIAVYIMLPLHLQRYERERERERWSWRH